MIFTKNIYDLCSFIFHISWTGASLRNIIKVNSCTSMYAIRCSHRSLTFLCDWLTELGFNDTSTLVGHFVSSPREWEKRERRDSRGDERERQGRKENEWQWRNRRNENIHPQPLPAARIAGLAQLYANISWTPLPPPTTPTFCMNNFYSVQFYSTGSGYLVSTTPSVLCPCHLKKGGKDI